MTNAEFNQQVQQVEFVFAPEERDVYSYERTRKDLAPLGAKPGSATIAEAHMGDCAPMELRRVSMKIIFSISHLTLFDISHLTSLFSGHSSFVILGDVDSRSDCS
jgi:hypothetical protein